MWVFAILIVLVLGGVAAVAAGFGSTMPPAQTDHRDVLLPADGPLQATDLRNVRFSVELRGYRMSEVDALLARLAAEAEEREARTAGPGPAEAVEGTPSEAEPVEGAASEAEPPTGAAGAEAEQQP